MTQISFLSNTLKTSRIFLGIAGVAALYLRFIRPWQLRWGATDQEVARPMQGDDIVQSPTFNATRAVTIEARPEHIFPWIVQMGVTRAGWYSIDLLDNLGKPSAEVILLEFQDPHMSDVIPMSPDGKSETVIKNFVPNEWMLWGDKNGDSSWVWGLYPIDETQTRLITRVRVQYHWLSPTILFGLLVEFTDIIMMRQCMLGIQRRAERLAKGGNMKPTMPVTGEPIVAKPTFAQWLYTGHRPNWIAQIMNRMSAIIAASGITSNYMETLEVIGRKSGRVVSLPVVVAIVDGQRYLVSMLGDSAQWVLNVQADGGKAVMHSGRRTSVQLVDVPVEERAPILKVYLKRAPGARPHIPVDKDAPLADFEKIAADFPVFRIVADLSGP